MPVVLTVAGLQALVDALAGRGYEVYGPTVRDGVVAHERISSVEQLPRGVGDDQDAGRYRLRHRDDGALFGYASAAGSWKALLYPARQPLLRLTRSPEPAVTPVEVDEPARALLGVRSCDLHALGISDRVLAGRAAAAADYAERRARTFVVAVACGHPGGTCFCASMGTGPRPSAGYDVLLTELIDEGGHRLLAEPGSPAGADLLDALPSAPAGPAEAAAAERVEAGAVAAMGRRLDTDGLPELLYASAEHPHWAEVARRCLTCGACTLVCPTCFCTAVEDVADLTAAATERVRVWDSCFTTGFSHLHGGSVRTSGAARYRQWATHKLAGWVDQFGTSGCVGCGRCITWCPAGIDLTAEVAALRADAAPVPAGPPNAGPVPATTPNAGPVPATTSGAVPAPAGPREADHAHDR